jgi:simple sugar transport system permease protein
MTSTNHRNIKYYFEGEVAGLLIFLIAVVVAFSLASPNFLTATNLSSMAIQLPALGLLTLAMLIPILSGGLNLSITYTANMSGLALAWTLQALGGPEAGVEVFVLGCALALTVGALSGFVIGVVVAYTKAHPILVSLSMMILMRGIGEFLSRGKDITGFPKFVQEIGQGAIWGIPIPMLVFIVCAVAWHIILSRTRQGFGTYMLGSNIMATAYSGVATKRNLIVLYTLSGLMCAVAGIVMLSQFNSVRVGHGESFLLITVLACFLGAADPFGGFGRVLPVFLALVILQVLSSGLNILGANQHLSTALWGIFLLAVVILRWAWWRYSAKLKWELEEPNNE